MTVTGFIGYAQGWGGLYIRANKLAWKLIDAHPGVGIKNRFGIPDCPERVHWEEEFAHEVGAPGAYDYGPERCSWLTHHLTNWMGDDGFLRHADLQDPPPQSGGRHPVHQGQGEAQVRRGRAVTSSRSSRRRATRTTSCRCWARGSWNCRVGAEARRLAHACTRPLPRCADRSSRHRPVARAGRPALHADAGRPRRRRHQGRAADGRRDAAARPALRRGRRRRLFRRRQPRQARARPRPGAARRTRRPRSAADGRRRRWWRTFCPAPWKAGAWATTRFWRNAIRA